MESEKCTLTRKERRLMKKALSSYPEGKANRWGFGPLLDWHPGSTDGKGVRVSTILEYG